MLAAGKEARRQPCLPDLFRTVSVARCPNHLRAHLGLSRNAAWTKMATTEWTDCMRSRRHEGEALCMCSPLLTPQHQVVPLPLSSTHSFSSLPSPKPNLQSAQLRVQCAVGRVLAATPSLRSLLSQVSKSGQQAGKRHHNIKHRVGAGLG